VAITTGNRLEARNDLAWAISVGGIGIVLFATLVLFTWYFAATLFLIFAGMLLGVALNAMTNLLGRVVKLPHALRLTIVCLVLASLLSGVIFLGGTTIAQQATVLSNTIKSQLVGVKAFLEKNGIDTSYFDLGSPGTSTDSSMSASPGAAAHNLPSAGTIALARSARLEISSSCCFSGSHSQPNRVSIELGCCSSFRRRSVHAQRSSLIASAQHWSAG